MSAARLTRSGRGRCIIGFGVLIFTFGFIAIFHNSQTQLDESRQQRLRCEQQQEALNARMQAIIEHKFRLERSLEAERKEHLETRQNLEQKVKEQNDQHSKAKMESDLHYDNLHQKYSQVQKEYRELVDDYAKSKKIQVDRVNSLESKTKSLDSQLQQVQRLNDKTMEDIQSKYDLLVQEKDRLEILLKTVTESNKKKIGALKEILQGYKAHCDYKPPNVDGDILSVSTISQQEPHQNPSPPLDRNQIQRSFNKQQLMIPEPFKNNEEKNGVAGNIPKLASLNATAKLSTASSGRLSGLVGNIGNTHALPVANQATTPIMNKAKRSNNPKELIAQRRPKQIPHGVAPIPLNIDDLLRNDLEDSQLSRLNKGNQFEKNDGEDADNNRYANVVEDLKKGDAERDTGAHEIKDEKNIDIVNNAGDMGPRDGDDIEMLGMGGGRSHNQKDDDDIAHIGNAILDGDNLNNEVVGDQGKEQFVEGLQLDEANEEEEDDDYLNPAARKQKDEAIRN